MNLKETIRALYDGKKVCPARNNCALGCYGSFR